ncbi:hypothetical protein [Cerasicoccus maritimus]|uniref:hypothetical protein n=1 Tax=Cerasicoccus maritimus TaxID=490089 RepID=UPI002852A0DD|nr:hypothetical protein [Cerasicoccus maritimus]
MPLNSPEDYVKLAEHLKEIDTIFQQFLRDSGYSDNTGSLGRYPHRSAIQHHLVWRKIDLIMDTDDEGNKYDMFHPDVTYTLWGGSWLDENGVRYGASRPSDANFLIFERLPFSQVKPILLHSLIAASQRLAGVTTKFLKNQNIKTTIQRS